MTIDIAHCKPSRCTGTYREENMASDEWSLEEKYDGARYVAIYNEAGKPALYSRYRFPAIEKAHLVPCIFPALPELPNTVLDGEMLSPTTPPLSGVVSWMGSKDPQGECPLWYVVFDCLFYKGEDIRSKPLGERRQYAALAVAEIQKRVGVHRIHMAENNHGALNEVLLKSILDAGKEGGVLKHLGSSYGTNWVKIKKMFDLSTIVSGFKPGKGKYAHTIGAVSLSVWKDGQLVEVGHCSGMTDAERVHIGQNPEMYLTRVLDVYAQEVTKDGRLRHPRFHRFRDDVEAADVTWEKLIDDCNVAKAQAKAKGLTSEA